MTRFLFSVIFILLLVSCRKDDSDITPSTRTIIVYMAADNDLSEDAWDNINEMQRGYIEKGINLIVFIDPSDDVPQILRVNHGGTIRVKTYPEFNSADVTQMRQVLNDIVDLYPAASYGLVLWSHGTSWFPAGSRLKSFGEDSGQQMNVTDLASALPFRFDFILMDACLMGSVEVVYELRAKADFIIASSTEIIYTGFPYGEIIPELLRTEPDLKKVAEDYFNFYNQQSGVFRSATISLIDTKEMDRLAMVTAQLIAGRAFDAGTFDRTPVQRLDVYHEQYVFDFFDFIEKAFPDENCESLKEQLGKAVLYQAHTPSFIDKYNIRTFCGLSCYIPHPQRSDLNTFYQQLDWCKNSGYSQLFQ